MTKQEEIREGMARIICCFAEDNKCCDECEYNTPTSPFPDCFYDIREDTDKLFKYLHSQGLVLQVDELPIITKKGWYYLVEPIITDNKLVVPPEIKRLGRR